jgi:alkylation response protein AidB-like acyl-CoA dehydrogenase
MRAAARLRHHRRVTSPDPFERARQIADDVLFPAAMAVEGADRVPAGQLDLLAAEGFYGLACPAACGGLDVDFPAACSIIEALASGCLTTTFVWLQHHGAVRAVLAGPAGLREEWLAPLCTGTRRAGIALGGALPGPPALRARSVPGGYLLDGISPWVTGWGMIDVLHVAARDDQDNIVTALTPAEAGPTLAAEPLRMVAVMASSTVELRLHSHFVPAGQVTAVSPHRDWLARDAMGLRTNGSLALGVIARCCALIGPSPLDGELAARRAALDAASPEQMPAARAAAAALAVRAAAALTAVTGSRAILADEHPQRLAREALFLLVFASRPAIRESLAGRLTAAPA